LQKDKTDQQKLCKRREMVACEIEDRKAADCAKDIPRQYPGPVRFQKDAKIIEACGKYYG
jgi:hypothetical protein